MHVYRNENTQALQEANEQKGCESGECERERENESPLGERIRSGALCIRLVVRSCSCSLSLGQGHADRASILQVVDELVELDLRQRATRAQEQTTHEPALPLRRRSVGRGPLSDGLRLQLQAQAVRDLPRPLDAGCCGRSTDLVISGDLVGRFAQTAERKCSGVNAGSVSQQMVSHGNCAAHQRPIRPSPAVFSASYRTSRFSRNFSCEWLVSFFSRQAA